MRLQVGRIIQPVEQKELRGVGRPPLPPGAKQVNRKTCFDAQTYAVAQSLAVNDLSFSAYIRRLVWEDFKRSQE